MSKPNPQRALGPRSRCVRSQTRAKRNGTVRKTKPVRFTWDSYRRLTHVESTPPAVTMESTKTRDPQQGAALMKRSTKYVALDVHQATTVASVREEGGRVIARSVLPTDGGALTEFVRGMRGARHVTFEEGTQAQWLYDLLAPLVDRVVVCDRRGTPRQGNKGDQVEADQLSELLRRGALRAVYHGSADRATLKELTRTYRNLVEDATRVMLRLKALFRARGIPTAGTAVYHPDRKSTRLNSSHGYISYAVFCLKKKKTDSTHRSVKMNT